MNDQKFEIRFAKEKDARPISELILKAVEGLEDKSYTEEQLSKWKKISSREAVEERLKKEKIFCAFDGENMVGTIGLEGHEIVAFYINPIDRKFGIGGLLISVVEDYALNHDITQLKIVSIPSAVSYYQKKGYTFVKDVLTVVDGITYEEMEMQKIL
ncbi:MAG: GNAT family N-acetyltransferase [Bacteroidota bacterium]